MYGYEPRDRSGPMDVDDQNPLSRLESFALPQPEDGPARKRLHSDISTPYRPFQSSTPSKPLHFGQDTPFMFHLPPSSSSSALSPSIGSTSAFRPYNPSEWARTDFGFGQGTQSTGKGFAGVEDVEMSSDSPARTGAGKKPEEARKPLGEKKDGDAKEVEVEERPIAQGAVGRVRRKRQNWKRSRRRDSLSEDEEPPLPRKSQDIATQPSRSEHQHNYNFHVPTPALRHSDIPALLLAYLQFFVNAAIVVFVLYLAVQFVMTVRRDVQDRMQEVSIEILQEIAECSTLYLTNRCDPILRVPAMEAPCKAWDACMNRDPTLVGRTNVMAETFAGVINSFVDPISWKTMGFTLVTLSFLIILTNSALWNLRTRAQPADTAQHQPPPGLFPPPQFMQHSQLGGPVRGMGEGPGLGQIGWEEEKKGKKGWW